MKRIDLENGDMASALRGNSTQRKATSVIEGNCRGCTRPRMIWEKKNALN